MRMCVRRRCSADTAGEETPGEGRAYRDGRTCVTSFSVRTSNVTSRGRDRFTPSLRSPTPRTEPFPIVANRESRRSRSRRPTDRHQVDGDLWKRNAFAGPLRRIASRESDVKRCALSRSEEPRRDAASCVCHAFLYAWSHRGRRSRALSFSLRRTIVHSAGVSYSWQMGHDEKAPVVAPVPSRVASRREKSPGEKSCCCATRD